MNWDNATVLKFLELYRINPCIWDPQNELHKNRRSVNDAWNKIKCKLGVTCSIKDLKKKKESLMSAYRAYKSKIKKSEKSGEVEVYQPTWFAYSLMDGFLGPIYKCKTNMTTEIEKDTASKFDEYTKTEIDTSSTNESNPEQESSVQYESLQHSTPGAQANVRMMPSSAPKRRLYNPTELIQARKNTDEALNFTKAKSATQQKDFDDECSVYGVLIAKKLRKLSDERKDVMMVKINQLFVDERNKFNAD